VVEALSARSLPDFLLPVIHIKIGGHPVIADIINATIGEVILL